ncbi:MAG TPA: hydrogenase maturation protease [Euryarchaeota archaeon]|nr:hydrogenase maturation protease [Euryarchaeota archaeon]
MSPRQMRIIYLSCEIELMYMEVPELYQKRVLVLGCGNILFGDDGFGVEVANCLNERYDLPSDVEVMDVGTGVRDILFNMVLMQGGPSKLIVVDAVDKGRRPGEVFKISLDEIPKNKVDDFSMHQMPSSNMLSELRDFCGVDVVVVACQVKRIPEEIETGLSEEVKKAIPLASELIVECLIKENG